MPKYKSAKYKKHYNEGTLTRLVGDTYVAPELEEVIISPKNYNPIGTKVSRSLNRVGMDYVLPAVSTFTMPGEALVTNFISKGMSKAANPVIKGVRKLLGKSERGGDVLDFIGISKGGKPSEDILAEYVNIIKESKSNGSYLRMPDGSLFEGDPRAWVKMQSSKFKQNFPTNKQLYHGSPNDNIEIFKPKGDSSIKGRSTGTEGIYTSPSKSYAERYTKRDLLRDIDSSGGRIYDLVTDPSKLLDAEGKSFIKIGDTTILPSKLSTDDRALLEGFGFNGIDNFSPMRKKTETVLFDSNQLKNILHNNGEFNPANPNIYKSNGGILMNKKIRKDTERPITLGRTIDNPIAKGPRVLAPVKQTNTINQSLQPTSGRRRPVKFTPIELLRSKFNPDSNWQLNDEEFLYNLQAERGGNPTNPKLWREAMTGAKTGQEDYSRRYTNNFALGGAPVIMSAPAIASIGISDPSNTWLGQPEQPQQMMQGQNPAMMNPQQQMNPQPQTMAYGGHMYALAGPLSTPSLDFSLAPTNPGTLKNIGGTGGGFGSAIGEASGISGMASGALSAIGSGIGLSQIGDTGIDDQVNQLKNFSSTANSLDSLQDEWSQFQPMDNVSWRDVDGRSKGAKATGVLSAIGSGASAGAVASPIGAAIGAIGGLGVGLAGLFSGNRKAKRKAKRLNKEIDQANERALSSLETRADAIDTENNWNAMANFSAYGGPLGDNLFSDGGSIHIKPSKKGTFTAEAKKHGKSVQAFASQVLANKENYSPALVKKAVFARNASKWSHALGGELDKKKTDKPSFEDYYKTVPIEKNDTTNYNLRRAYELAPYEDMIKFAQDKDFHLNSVYENPETGEYNFVKAKNHPTLNKELEWYNSKEGESFRKKYDLDTTGNYYKYTPRKKALGGYVNDDFRTDFTEFNTGGTHEESPLGGIPMGIAEDGQPNLVEEGETKYKDYVFSDRLGLDDIMLEGSGLPKHLKGKTFSDASKELAKESKERPNDPISKRTLKSNMAKLMTLQEGVREAIEASQENEYAGGGLLPNNQMLPNRGFSGNPWDMGDSLIGSEYAVPNSGLSTALAPVNTTLPPESYPDYPKDWTFGPDALRYAPVVGSIASMFVNNKPNYGNAERIERARERVDFNPIGNYLTYNPLDRNYYTNQLNAQSGATKRGIVNQSGGNRATATAGLLAADYNYNQGLGVLARQSEEYNQAQRERVEGFNRGTNQYNSQGAMQADSMNAELGLRSAIAGAQMREQERNMTQAAKSANLTKLFDNLGDIGREEFQRNMINSNPSNYYRIGRDGKISYDNMDALTDEQRKEVKKAAQKAARALSRKKKSHGGYLTL